MFELQGIPGLTDLTHAGQLLAFGKHIIDIYVVIFVLAAVFGIVLAMLCRSQLPDAMLGKWASIYGNWLAVLHHGVVIICVLAVTALLGSTLANRYHFWEQSRIQQKAQTVEGYRLEQPAPTVRYLTKKSYVRTEYRDGKLTDVPAETVVSNFWNLTSSRIDVQIDQKTNQQDSGKQAYTVTFDGTYCVKNTLETERTFYFDAYTPGDYILLKDFKVERDGEKMESKRVNERSFKFRLAPGESTAFKISYSATGDPRWVYNANQVLLSDFQLQIKTNYAGAQFASGVPPTRTEWSGGAKTFVWDFKENVSVRNPFGVFTGIEGAHHSGVIPRVLLLLPGILAWWLLLLYLTVNVKPGDVVVLGIITFACALALTYGSRLVDPFLVWLILSLVLPAVTWIGGKEVLRAFITPALIGFVIPVMALLVPYSGLTLSLSALLAVGWIARHRRSALDSFPAQGTGWMLRS